VVKAPDSSASTRPRSSTPTSDMPRQLSLDLSTPPGGAPGDFFVTPATQAAHAAVMGDTPWPQGKLVLAGPQASGKTHLLRLWAAREGATLLSPGDLALSDARPPPGAVIGIDDADALPPAAEEAIFHLHNHLAATGGRLLMTARRPPARWSIALPDLASRLQATAIAQLGDPDDRLLALLLARLMADRQILPSAGVIPYLLTRMERSHTAACDIVAALDSAALAEGRGITRDLARAVLDNREAGAR
jgi:chromosomal replication initiation ATPase DnaA